MNKRKFLSTVGMALPCLSVASIISTKPVINADFIVNTIIPRTSYYNIPIYYAIGIYRDGFRYYDIGAILEPTQDENNISVLNTMDTSDVYNLESDKSFVSWKCLLMCYYISFPYEYGVKRIHFTKDSFKNSVKHDPTINYTDVMLEDWLNQQS